MEKELPKIDLPEDWTVGTDISKELLSLYKNYPIRLKCEIVVLCMSGEIEALINLNHVTVMPNNVITLLPGTIFQVNDIKGDLKIYFLGFSSAYLENKERAKSLLQAIYFTLGKPQIKVSEKEAGTIQRYFELLIDLYENYNEKAKEEMAENIFVDTHKGINILYGRLSEVENPNVPKSEQLCRAFTELVMKHYSENRNVSWYAEKLEISHAHLCSIVKQTTGKNCADIISSMVIMDAKSQLKSTQQSIQNISDSLNFANMSFFGKYFKRHTGMSPLEYRNKG